MQFISSPEGLTLLRPISELDIVAASKCIKESGINLDDFKPELAIGKTMLPAVSMIILAGVWTSNVREAVKTGQEIPPILDQNTPIEVLDAGFKRVSDRIVESLVGNPE